MATASQAAAISISVETETEIRVDKVAFSNASRTPSQKEATHSPSASISRSE